MNNIRLVKIKTWEQMEQEFGLDEDGNINCKYSFTTNMEKDIPQNRIIVLLDDEKFWWYNEWYEVSDDMIEEELDPKDYPEYLI